MVKRADFLKLLVGAPFVVAGFLIGEICLPDPVATPRSSPVVLGTDAREIPNPSFEEKAGLLTGD
jgi:hypothetical protein